MADRAGVGLRAEALDLVKGEFRSGGDDEIVVGDRPAVAEFDLVLRRIDPLGADGMEADPHPREHRRQVDLDVLRLSPVHRNPRIRRDELKPLRFGDHIDLRRLAEPFAQLERHRRAADPGPNNDNSRHLNSSRICALTIDVTIRVRSR